MEESGPVSAKTCARCGLTIAPGYAKCPRCHAELPAARARRRLTDGGGTVVDRRLAPQQLALIGAGVAALGLVAWLVLRGGDEPQAGGVVDGEDAAEPGEDDPEAADDPPTRDLPRPRPPPTAPPPSAPGADRNGAIGGLVRALRAERLWASVRGEGDVVLIDSAFCDDPGLGALVDAATAELRDVGFTAIRCRAPHGATIFERGL